MWRLFMLKIIPMDNILKEIELISIEESVPKDLIDKYDIQIGIIRNESIKKFYGYFLTIDEALEKLDDQILELENENDGKVIADETRRIEHEKRKLEDKAEALQYFYNEMLGDEFGKQVESFYR